MTKYLQLLFFLYMFCISCNGKYAVNVTTRDDSNDTSFTDMSNEFPKDTIIFRFQDGFNKDNVCIDINGANVFCKTLTSDPSSEFAGYYYYGPLSNVESIGIKINNSETYNIVSKFEPKFRFVNISLSKTDTFFVFMNTKGRAFY